MGSHMFNTPYMNHCPMRSKNQEDLGYVWICSQEQLFVLKKKIYENMFGC